MTVQLSHELVNFVRPSEHSRFSPSGTDRWVNCPASIRLSDPIPDETSKWAAEGTTAHTVCEDLFAHKYWGHEKSPTLMMADQEMIDCAEDYYACVTGWLKNEDDIGDVLWFGLEKGIPIFPERSCFGTADFVAIGTKGCAIIDFKYGKGKAVGANSTQLFNYLLGLYRYLIDIPDDYKFHAVVVQPRIDAIPKVHEYTKADFKQFEAIVYKAILEADAPGLEPNPGNHCFWCKAKRTNDPNLKCPAIKQKQLQVANENFDSFLQDMNAPVGKDRALVSKRDKALLKVMSLLPMMKEIAKDAEEEFKYRIEQGETIEGLHIADVQGRAKWKLDDPRDMAREIRRSHPEVMEPAYMTQPTLKVMNISQIKKVVGKANFDESLIVRPIKKELVIQDRTTREVLGELTEYSKMIGINEETNN